MDEKIRINKYLSDIGVCSRREADRLTEAGRVTANGELVSTGMKILPDAEICIDGKPVKKQEKKILLLFHKPKGIVCSTRQQRNEMTVTEYLDYPVRIYPIGRLDKDSEGLLLLTNEGDLVNRIMKAGNYHEKEYQVTVNKRVTEEFIVVWAAECRSLIRSHVLQGYKNREKQFSYHPYPGSEPPDPSYV